MVDLARFDEVAERLETEAAEKSRLAETSRRIKKNIERTRSYEPTPQNANLLTSNMRQARGTYYSESRGREVINYLRHDLDRLNRSKLFHYFRIFTDFENTLFSKDILESLARNGDPLAQGIIEEIADFASKTSGRFEDKWAITGWCRGVAKGLLYRTMTEPEYMDYLEGRNPFVGFDFSYLSSEAKKKLRERTPDYWIGGGYRTYSIGGGYRLEDHFPEEEIIREKVELRVKPEREDRLSA